MTTSSSRNLAAEKRHLRSRMRLQGLSDCQIAAEFARRYGLRPRKAWREARGLSLTEAAAAINEYLADVGLDPEGKSPVSVAHLCEYENFPGFGDVPQGRKPTLYILTLMAVVYGTTPAMLVDTIDRDHIPLADLLLVDACAARHARDPLMTAAGPWPPDAADSRLAVPRDPAGAGRHGGYSRRGVVRDIT